MRLASRVAAGVAAVGISLSVLATTSWASAAPIVPIYHSAPDLARKVYLDFNGDTTADFGPYHPNTTPAYSTDADTDHFSPQELDNIFKIWEGVSEKYSPFNLDVTTQDPGVGEQFTKVVIGGDGAWAPSAPDGSRPGGIAITGSYVLPLSGTPHLAFVFPTQLVNGFPRYVAEAAAHEVGHGFGLSHQSLYVNGQFTKEYNPGDALKAPIMGRSYFAQRGLWWVGPTPDNSSPTAQDDLAILSDTRLHTNQIGYRADDYANNIAGAWPLTIRPDFSLSDGDGIIEQTTDSDFTKFVAPTVFGASVPAHIVADVAPFAPMLDLTLKLYDSSGNLLATSATPSLGESIDYLLSAGQTYEISVSSAGSYGDIGQYFLSGYVPEPASTTACLLPLFLLIRRHPRRSHRSV